MLGEERRKGKGWEGGQCEHVGRLSPCGSSGVPSGDAREGKLQHLPFSFPLCFPTCLFSPIFLFHFFFHFVYETGCTWIWKDWRQQKVNTTIYQSSRNICVHSTRTRMPSKASLKIHREPKSMPCPWVPPVFDNKCTSQNDLRSAKLRRKKMISFMNFY